MSDLLDLLRDGAAGALLAGARARVLVPRILDGLRALPVVPVRLQGDGTVKAMRAAVERAFKARPDRSIPLLLLVDDADRLTDGALEDLELAAACREW